jgi:hypothetical protein
MTLETIAGTGFLVCSCSAGATWLQAIAHLLFPALF